MVALGFWQLGRTAEKEALIARSLAAQAEPAPVSWPRTPEQVDAALYRRSSLTCNRVLEMRATAGRSARGASGWMHVARCARRGGGEAEVALGWSGEPAMPAWSGGAAQGFVAPAGDGARLIASPPQAGLAPLAKPDPRDLPNNHLAYAVQWFFFAITAVVIYWLALRRRGR